MAFQNFRANRLWPRQMDVSIGRSRFQTIAAGGTIGVEFLVKIFPTSGRALTFSGRVRSNSSTLTGTVPPMIITGGGGFRMQAYWKFKYDLDIGALSKLTRFSPARALANSRVTGLYNIIQCFDLVPPTQPGRSGRPYAAVFRNIRGDNRSGGARWTWQITNNRSVRPTRSGPSIVTTTRAVLPTSFSGSLSTEVSTQIGAEMGWDLGPTVTGNASVGAAAGASVDVSYQRDLMLRLIGNFQPVAVQ
jgi:hypothetical protein